MSVFGLLSGVAGFVKVRYLIDKAIIDNMIFRAHYRITSAILFVCCIVVTANNLIGKFFASENSVLKIVRSFIYLLKKYFSGDPIACINDGAVPNHVINTYCWITYTFTLPGQHGNIFVLHFFKTFKFLPFVHTTNFCHLFNTLRN